MTDIQVLIISLTFAVLAAVLIYSNSRVGEFEDSADTPLTDRRGGLQSEMRCGFDRLERLVTLHLIKHHNK